jgi:hypothetical protein
MKERNIYGDEFEEQLKEKTDQLKMYPSDKVWNEVYSSLHVRRRKFIAGMTFLIGGILILAGTQLIFPSRNTNPKTIAAKIINPSKPAAAADLHNFTASGFATETRDNDGDQQNRDGGPNANVPFLHRSSISSGQKSGTDEYIESLPEKIQNNGREKTVQQASINVAVHADATLSMTGLNEEEESSEINPALNRISADLDPEKSLTQLSHIRNDRFSWEIYIAPTLNNHYLSGMNYQTAVRPIQTAPIMVVHFANVNGFVDNTQAMGYEVGGNILYRISKNISLKAGLDFSFNRYYIKAYNSNQSQASATLSSYFGYIADTLANSNSGNNLVNKNPQHYQNRYYQLSLPVGVDMKVAGNKKLQLHVGATLQPSYLLNTDAYVLSEDYSSYVKDAQAFRRWNLIGGAEVYVSYAVGKIRWEIGPQVRYQIFSTYRNSYPLQENMLNYGIRIGISKSIR